MRSQKLLLIGAAAILAGISLMAISFTGTGSTSVYAGEDPCAPSSPTPNPDPSAINEFTTLGGSTNPCITTTPQLAKTHTPTNTPTAAATDTPAPSTEVPTAVPATSTPSGGAGAGVQPPNTGSGPTDGATPMWVYMLAVALVAGGVGTIALGSRKN